MKKSKSILLLGILCSLALFQSCKDDEVITWEDESFWDAGWPYSWSHDSNGSIFSTDRTLSKKEFFDIVNNKVWVLVGSRTISNDLTEYSETHLLRDMDGYYGGGLYFDDDKVIDFGRDFTNSAPGSDWLYEESIIEWHGEENQYISFKRKNATINLIGVKNGKYLEIISPSGTYANPSYNYNIYEQSSQYDMNEIMSSATLWDDIIDQWYN